MHEVEATVRVEREDALPLCGADLRHVGNFDERPGRIHHADDSVIALLQFCEQRAHGVLLLQSELPRHDLARRSREGCEQLLGPRGVAVVGEQRIDTSAGERGCDSRADTSATAHHDDHTTAEFVFRHATALRMIFPRVWPSLLSSWAAPASASGKTAETVVVTLPASISAAIC